MPALKHLQIQGSTRGAKPQHCFDGMPNPPLSERQDAQNPAWVLELEFL